MTGSGTISTILTSHDNMNETNLRSQKFNGSSERAILGIGSDIGYNKICYIISILYIPIDIDRYYYMSTIHPCHPP